MCRILMAYKSWLSRTALDLFLKMMQNLEDFCAHIISIEVDKAAWAKEAEGIEEFYKQFGDKLPEELKNQLATLKKNCQ